MNITEELLLHAGMKSTCCVPALPLSCLPCLQHYIKTAFFRIIVLRALLQSCWVKVSFSEEHLKMLQRSVANITVLLVKARMLGPPLRKAELPGPYLGNFLHKCLQDKKSYNLDSVIVQKFLDVSTCLGSNACGCKCSGILCTSVLL